MDMIENNLKNIIDQYKRDNPLENNKTIAAKKGVTPETVSRHCHDKIDMSMQDITDYAKILGCSTQDILYKNSPLAILANVGIDDNGWLDYQASTDPKTARCVYLHGVHQQYYAVCYYSFPEEYQGPFKWMDGCMEMISTWAIIEAKVSPAALMKPCIARGVDEKVYAGILFPQPGSHKYTIVRSAQHGNANKNMVTDLELEWASPILRYYMQPDLERAQIVSVEQNATTKKIVTDIHKKYISRLEKKGIL